jgi:hypothetical protein
MGTQKISQRFSSNRRRDLETRLTTLHQQGHGEDSSPQSARGTSPLRVYNTSLVTPKKERRACNGSAAMLALVVGNSLLQLLNVLSGLSYLCVVQKTFASAQGGKLGNPAPGLIRIRPSRIGP